MYPFHQRMNIRHRRDNYLSTLISSKTKQKKTMDASQLLRRKVQAACVYAKDLSSLLPQRVCDQVIRSVIPLLAQTYPDLFLPEHPLFLTAMGAVCFARKVCGIHDLATLFSIARSIQSMVVSESEKKHQKEFRFHQIQRFFQLMETKNSFKLLNVSEEKHQRPQSARILFFDVNESSNQQCQTSSMDTGNQDDIKHTTNPASLLVSTPVSNMFCYTRTQKHDVKENFKENNKEKSICMRLCLGLENQRG